MAKILIIDDEANVLRMLTDYLTTHGWDVSTAATGEAGLQAATAHVPDVVLSDVNLPDIDGFAVARALRQDVKTASIPVVLISGAEKSPEAVVKGLDEGSLGYLLKPIDMRVLDAKLKSVLKGGAPKAR